MFRKQIPLEKLPFKNDFMFGAVLSDPNICKMFLEKLLGIAIARIQMVQRQKVYEDSYEFRGARLDLYVEDDAGNVFDVEMQSTDKGGLPLRARRYTSVIDRELLDKGESYRDASPLYIIFVCDYDPVGFGYAKYERVSFYRDIPVEYNDETHVLFLNSHYHHDSTHSNASPEILEVLDYLRTSNDKAHYDSDLATSIIQKVNEVRCDRKWGAEYMSWSEKITEIKNESWAEGNAEGLAKGNAEGLVKGRTEATVDFVRKNLITIKQAAEELGITEDEFMRLMENTK